MAGGLQSRLGADRSESAALGAAVGAGVDAARSAAEGADGGDGSACDKPSNDSNDDSGSSFIPHLYAPGELLYICCPQGASPPNRL